MLLKQDEIDRIVNNYKGQSVLSYSKELGYSPYAIKKYLEKAGVELGRKWQSKETKELIVKEYLTGKSASQVAREFNINLETVLRFVKQAGHIIKNTPKVSRGLNYNRDYFEDINTEEKAYWLGFIVADGCITEKISFNKKTSNKQLQISLAIKDKQHLEKFKAALEYSGDIKIRKKSSGYANFEGCSIVICSNKLCNDLAKWGVTPRKTFNCKFPYNIPTNLYKHFIRGYWDGDGHLGLTQQQVGCIGNTKFINSIQTVCRRFNNKLTKVKLFPVKSTKGMARYRKGGRLQSSLLANWLYKDAKVYLDRKYNLYLERYAD